MTAFQLQTPFAFFVDTNGKPLDAGYIWIGAANTNPEETQIPVYWDDALTIPAVQPIRTIGGYPSRNGSAAQVFTGQYYAITVRNNYNALVFSNAFAADMVAAQLLTMAANRVEQTFDTVYGTSLYPLDFDPASAALMLVTLNGVVQSAGDHFSLAAMPSAPSGKGIQLVDTTLPTGYRVDVVFDKPINYAVANQVSMDFATLAEFQAAVTAGLSLPDGRLVTAGGVPYVAETAAAVTGLPTGWRPVDWVYSRAELEAATWEVAPGRNVILVLESGFVVPYVRTAFATDLIAGDLSTWKVAGFTIADAVAIGNEIASANAALAASLRNISDGSAAAPGFKFSLDLDTGFYRPGDNQIGIATNGVSRAVLSDTALNVSVPITGAGVVGTVSESGGLSTGAIIESGSNTNGTYTKFADGTMICTKTVTGLGPISTASGSLFIQSPGVALGTLPQTFIAAPVRRVDCYSPTGQAAWVQSATAPTTTIGGTVQLVRATTTANTDFVITATFIGRWF